MEAVLMGVVGTAILFNTFGTDNKRLMKNTGTLQDEKVVGKPSKDVQAKVEPIDSEYASVANMPGRQPFQSCVDQQGAWISSNLLPKDTSSVSDDWSIGTPGNLQDRNFLEAGSHFGMDTVGSSHKNANLQLRSEPIIPRQTVSPFLNSSITPDDHRRRFTIENFE